MLPPGQCSLSLALPLHRYTPPLLPYAISRTDLGRSVPSPTSVLRTRYAQDLVLTCVPRTNPCASYPCALATKCPILTCGMTCGFATRVQPESCMFVPGMVYTESGRRDVLSRVCCTRHDGGT
eukprot:1996493-Rhodomonas_salina.1